MELTRDQFEFLLTPGAVRERCHGVLKRTLEGQGPFRVHEDRLGALADRVVAVTRENYPDLNIPYHSRWGHFRVGGVDRLAPLHNQWDVKSQLDLAVVSVLLDAGAGMAWRYQDAHGKTLSRSEGLAVASLEMFQKGAFSTDTQTPLRVDAEKLTTLKTQDLQKGFQVTTENPLVGVEGRTALMNRLGKTLLEAGLGRPGDLWDRWKNLQPLPASTILETVLRVLGPIWPGRLSWEGHSLGDVWNDPELSATATFESVVPFHKLSQWLTYSLIEPLEWGGLKVENLDGLTGLAEYRNGGLFLDGGVLELKDPSAAEKSFAPADPTIVHWRALTVALLDRLAPEVRSRLGLTAEAFPLPKMLEGGTWWTGRKLAAERRADGGPPLKLDSDGTVF